MAYDGDPHRHPGAGSDAENAGCSFGFVRAGKVAGGSGRWGGERLGEGVTDGGESN